MIQRSHYAKTRVLLFMILALFGQVACKTGPSHSAVYNDLVLRLESNNNRAEVGKPIQVRFSITNGGSQSFMIESQDTPVMDIVVQIVGGPDLFAWSTQNPDKIAHRLEWKPGESKTIELVWIPRPEDIASGYYKDVFLSGRLYSNEKNVQSAYVRVCASNICR
jgi:hypothetical protein